SALFLEYEWPGNVRQLENLIKRMVVLGSEAPIVQELQQPAAQFHHWPAQAPTSIAIPRPAPPPLHAVVPPQAVAAAGAPRRSARWATKWLPRRLWLARRRAAACHSRTSRALRRVKPNAS